MGMVIENFQFLYSKIFFSRPWRRNPRENEDNQPPPPSHVDSKEPWRNRNDDQR